MPSHNDGVMIVLSSPSGAGKTTLVKKLSLLDDFEISISHTTRQPRPGENNAEHYHFVAVDEFKKLIEANDFLEWAQVFENYYGTSKQSIESQLAQGIDVFLDIDWQGAQQMRKVLPEVQTIFILPPSKQELENRLNSRGQDSAEVIKSRMDKAQAEMSHYNEFDFLIINDDFDTALYQLETIVFGQRLKQSNQALKFNTLINDLLPA